MIDLNILLDIMLRREPWFMASANVCAEFIRNKAAFVPAHSVTTLVYLVRKQNPMLEMLSLHWLMKNIRVATEDHSMMSRAMGLGFSDFEDAVVVAAAEKAKCDIILSRNIRDFVGSPIPVRSPEELLKG